MPSTATRALPFIMNLPTGFDPGSVAHYISELNLFLSSPLVESLIQSHPNEVATRQKWIFKSNVDSDSDWWAWAGKVDTKHREALVEALIQSAISRQSISPGESIPLSSKIICD